MAALPLQNLLDKNTGRYTFVTESQAEQYWGLTAVDSRCIQ